MPTRGCVVWAVLLTAACSPATGEPVQQPPTAAEPPAPAQPRAEAPVTETPAIAAPWSIVYADGAANVSRLSRASDTAPVEFEYDPVTPERSSTGTYSGGPPRQERVAPDDPRIDALWREVERLEADTAVHTATRNKGTGAFTVTTPTQTREFIVEHGPAQHEVERILASFGHAVP